MNPAVAIDLAAFRRCMGDAYGPGETPGIAELAAQEASCTEVIETGPKRLLQSAHFMRAQLRWQTDRKREAMTDMDALINLDPRNTDYYQGRASLHEVFKQYDLARADLMAALKISPLDASIHNSMCWSLALEGEDLERALSYCNIAIGLSPRNAPAWDSRGFVHLKMNEYDRAVSDYQRAIEIVRDRPHYMYGYGIALLRLGKVEAGKKWIDRAVAADPGIGKQYEGYGVKP